MKKPTATSAISVDDPATVRALAERDQRARELVADLRAEQEEEESLRNQLKKSRDTIEGLLESLAHLAESPVQQTIDLEAQP